MRRIRAGLHDVVGINRRNVELVYAHNSRRDFPLVDDKIVCKTILEASGVPVTPTIATCDGLYAVSTVAHTLCDRGDFVVKPASGSGGDGILVVGERTGAGWRTVGGGEVSEEGLRQHLANTVFGAFSKQLEDRALIEERISPHPFYRELYAGGVCDIRVLILCGSCLMAMVRIPTTRSRGRANLHQGGIGVAVDLASGRTTRALSRSSALREHPETGVALVDRYLPLWPEVVEVAQRAAASVPLGFLGVDIVVDELRGPVVLELNARPGLEIQNVNGRPLGPLVTGV